MKIIFTFFCFLLINVCVCQEWQQYFATHYRNLNDFHFHNSQIISFVGGYPYNDSLAYMAFTETGATSWTSFHDIFPGPMIRTQLFVNTNRGFCAGDNEALYETNNKGKDWSVRSFNISLNNRRVNKLIKDQYNNIYGVGGDDDSDGFFIKSVDQAQTWEIIYEWENNEILCIASNQYNKYKVCGNDSFIQYSDDGGQSWTNATVTGDFTSILADLKTLFFFDDITGYCAGGRQGADSVAVILKTIDGGKNWTTVYLDDAPRINSISIIDENTVYAVGDYGFVIMTEDGGNTWNNVMIPGNPGINFYAVKFINKHFGVITGHFGFIYIFNDGETGVPTIALSNANSITNHSAKIGATINPALVSTEITFYYGTTLNPNIEINAGIYNGGENIQISRILDNLEENTKYYYYAKINSEFGETLTEIKTFYTGNPIPNWDFEEWSSYNYQCPCGWICLGNMTKLNCDEGFGIGINTDSTVYQNGAFINGTIYAEFVDGEIVITGQSGGHPFSYKTNKVSCKMNYNINPNDSALLLVMMKNQGQIISEDFHYLTGSTYGNFIDTSFSINYSIDITPDSIIFGVTNTSKSFITPTEESFVEICNIWFEDTNENLYNHNFTDWEMYSFELPDNWHLSKHDLVENQMLQNLPLYKTEDSYYNDYAICLQITEFCESSEITSNNKTESFPVYTRHEYLEAYVKYIPDGIDTANLIIDFQFSEELPYRAELKLSEEINEWTRIIIPFVYPNDSIVPDSAKIFINSTNIENPKASIFCVDKICFDGDYIPVEQIKQSDDIQIYPNPFNDIITIVSSEFIDKVEIYDIKGDRLFNKSMQNKEFFINTEFLPSGIYLIKTLSNKSINNTKVIKL